MTRTTAELPEELDRWNWGAFGLTWVWGIANRTPAAWFTLIPFAGWIGMPFLLGLKGNAWAWHNRDWPDIDTFRRAQRAWAQRALATWAVLFVAVGGVAAGTAYLLSGSEAYRLARLELTSDPQLVEQLGSPIELGTPTGSLSTLAGGAGDAQLEFSVKGPKGQGRAYVSAQQELGSWQLQRVRIELDNGVGVERSLRGPGNLSVSKADE